MSTLSFRKLTTGFVVILLYALAFLWQYSYFQSISTCEMNKDEVRVKSRTLTDTQQNASQDHSQSAAVTTKQAATFVEAKCDQKAPNPEKKTSVKQMQTADKRQDKGQSQKGHASSKDLKQDSHKETGEKPPATKTQQNARPSKCEGCFRTDFPVLTDQPHVCQVRGKGAIDVVFLIESAITHREQRDAIRKTWASVSRNNTSNFRHVFVLGVTKETDLMRALEEEARHFRDVVVIGFRDSYMNLTLKTISSLRWFATRCKHARFFMKVDDDVWVNTQLVLSLLKNNSEFLQRGLGGYCSGRVKVQRDLKSKWYVPPAILSQKFYSPYCKGLAYAGSMNVAAKVTEVSKDVPFFFIEDVYVGMCLQRLGYGVKSLTPKFEFKRRKKEKCQGHNPLVPTILDIKPPSEFFVLWNAHCPPSNKH